MNAITMRFCTLAFHGSQSHGLQGQMLRVLIRSWAFVGCHSDGHFRPKSDWLPPNLCQQLPQLEEANHVKGYNCSIFSYSKYYMLFFGMQWDAATINGWLVHLKDVWTLIEHHKGQDDDLLHLLTSSVNLYNSSFDMVLKSDTPNLKWILIQQDVVSEVMLNVHFSKEI